MTNVFKGRHFLAEKDFTRAELEWLIDFSAHLKDLKKRNIPHRYLEGKNIALLFEKTSTRTRAAFTVASIDLGAHPEYLGANDIQLGKKESTEDTAKVLGRMFDGIEFRGFSQKNGGRIGRILWCASMEWFDRCMAPNSNVGGLLDCQRKLWQVGRFDSGLLW